jgi:FKBP-type peptidyl-prolyl cis-trans isomerase FklB
MHHYSLLWLLALLLLPLGLTSCSEEDAEENEFADWQNRNDTYFANIYSQAQQAIATGDSTWKIIRTWSMDTTLTSTNCIVVRVVTKGTGSGCPLYTDSVLVDYKGSLIPSQSYPSGYVFDQSWYGDTYDESSARPAHLGVSSVVDGFATALQNMHIGDNWIVYIPYQLGYGSVEQNNGVIPAYSVLIFDLHLRGYYRAGTTMPDNQAKPFF